MASPRAANALDALVRGQQDPARRRKGIRLGAAGLLLLFASALGTWLGPQEWILFLVPGSVLGVLLLFAGYLALR
jgi:hypothetical protein